jgi:hypothetical protein
MCVKVVREKDGSLSAAWFTDGVETSDLRAAQQLLQQLL